MASASENSVPHGDGSRAPAARPRRIEALDVARGVALLAMAVYHFTWDLEFFGYVERGMTGVGGWRLFARCIASSFLFLTGVSLVLAHGRAIRWKPFRTRFAQVAAGAAAITAVTYFATPTGFVFFGILHQIALASLLGLAFLRLPWAVTALIGVAVIALPQVFETTLTEPKLLAFIGMAERAPVSNDYVPLFPWFGAVLLGIAAGRLGEASGGLARLAALNESTRRLFPLTWLGRHSLAFYLLHQPALIALVWVFAQVSPPDPAVILESDCRRSCTIERGDAAFCRTYCSCIRTDLEKENLLEALLDGTTTTDEDDKIRGMVEMCAMPRP